MPLGRSRGDSSVVSRNASRRSRSDGERHVSIRSAMVVRAAFRADPTARRSTESPGARTRLSRSRPRARARQSVSFIATEENIRCRGQAEHPAKVTMTLFALFADHPGTSADGETTGRARRTPRCPIAGASVTGTRSTARRCAGWVRQGQAPAHLRAASAAPVFVEPHRPFTGMRGPRSGLSRCISARIWRIVLMYYIRNRL